MKMTATTKSILARVANAGESGSNKGELNASVMDDNITGEAIYIYIYIYIYKERDRDIEKERETISMEKRYTVYIHIYRQRYTISLDKWKAITEDVDMGNAGR